MHDLDTKAPSQDGQPAGQSQLFSKYSKGGVVTKESIVAVMNVGLDKRLDKIVKHADKNKDQVVNNDGKY